jgi:hypothetical protein
MNSNFHKAACRQIVFLVRDRAVALFPSKRYRPGQRNQNDLGIEQPIFDEDADTLRVGNVDLPLHVRIGSRTESFCAKLYVLKTFFEFQRDEPVRQHELRSEQLFEYGECPIELRRTPKVFGLIGTCLRLQVHRMNLTRRVNRRYQNDDTGEGGTTRTQGSMPTATLVLGGRVRLMHGECPALSDYRLELVAYVRPLILAELRANGRSVNAERGQAAHESQ